MLDLDDNYEIHLARLMILVSALSGVNRTEIKGITKLVKLDFLLRYPTVLNKALLKIGKGEMEIPIYPHEKNSVESKMVRFRYGPWDYRYYSYLAILESKGLVHVELHEKTIEIKITEKGLAIANSLTGMNDFKDFFERSNVINSAFGKISATGLKDMMYELVPELYEMKFGDIIDP